MVVENRRICVTFPSTRPIWSGMSQTEHGLDVLLESAAYGSTWMGLLASVDRRVNFLVKSGMLLASEWLESYLLASEGPESYLLEWKGSESYLWLKLMVPLLLVE